MKIGFLFPGQGSQFVGMGKDLYDEYECYRKVYERIKMITGIDIAEISFTDSDGKINETEYTQICVLAMSLGILEILNEKNVTADICAGLSLGEYTALIYSKLFDMQDGIKLVKNRGYYMQHLVPDGKWSMSAIIGLDDCKVEEACDMVKTGFVVPVNYNCVGQVVISGEAMAVEEAVSNAKKMGAKLAKILNTSGPFHTEKLTKSAEALKKDLDAVKYNNLERKVVKNIDGELYNNNDDFSDILMKHIISPVRFSKSIETMLEEGVDTFIEIGPGKTLSGFVKRMPKEKDVNILNISGVDTLHVALDFINESSR